MTTHAPSRRKAREAAIAETTRLNILHALHERGISISELGARSGLSVSHLSRVVRGLTTLSIGSGASIAAALGITIGELTQTRPCQHYDVTFGRSGSGICRWCGEEFAAPAQEVA